MKTQLPLPCLPWTIEISKQCQIRDRSPTPSPSQVCAKYFSYLWSRGSAAVLSFLARSFPSLLHALLLIWPWVTLSIIGVGMKVSYVFVSYAFGTLVMNYEVLTRERESSTKIIAQWDKIKCRCYFYMETQKSEDTVVAGWMSCAGKQRFYICAPYVALKCRRFCGAQEPLRCLITVSRRETWVLPVHLRQGIGKNTTCFVTTRGWRFFPPLSGHRYITSFTTLLPLPLGVALFLSWISYNVTPSTYGVSLICKATLPVCENILHT